MIFFSHLMQLFGIRSNQTNHFLQVTPVEIFFPRFAQK